MEDTGLEDLGCSLHLAEEQLERIEGHTLCGQHEQGCARERIEHVLSQ